MLNHVFFVVGVVFLTTFGCGVGLGCWVREERGSSYGREGMRGERRDERGERRLHRS